MKLQPIAVVMEPAEQMVLVNVTVNFSQLIVQVSYNVSLFSDLEVDLLNFFSFVLAFCNPNTTCNGQGTCGDNGICQCSDNLFGDDCSGKLFSTLNCIWHKVHKYCKKIFLHL